MKVVVTMVAKARYNAMEKPRKRITRNQYLERMARILCGESVILQVAEQSPCYVELKRKGFEDKLIVISDDDIPELPDNPLVNNITEEGVNLTEMAKEFGYEKEQIKLLFQRMFTYHEASHCKYTPINTKEPIDKAHRTLINMCEDRRIEGLMSKEYPPARKRFHALNRILLSRLNRGIVTETIDKEKLAMYAVLTAGRYYYGITDKEPKSPIVRRLVQVFGEIDSKPKKQFKQTEDYARELYELLEGVTFPEIIGDWGDGDEDREGNRTGEYGKQVKDRIEKDLRDEMESIESDIKDYGIEMVHKELRNDSTMRLKNSALVNQMAENLKRILGAKPSKYDKMDYDGESIDLEGLIEWKSSNYEREVKMFNKATKIAKPELFIAMCIDSSGSMAGRQIEIAKKSAVNLAYACESAKIYAMVDNFEVEAQMCKPFNQPTDECIVGGLQSGGGTYVASGVKMALDHMKLGIDVPPNAKCAIILLTDGCDGSARDVASMLIDKPYVHLYIIGINAGIGSYIQELTKYGIRVYGRVEIDDMNDLFRNMKSFVKDFVRNT